MSKVTHDDDSHPMYQTTFTAQPYPLWLTVDQGEHGTYTWLIVGWEYSSYHGRTTPVLAAHQSDTMTAEEITNPLDHVASSKSQIRISPVDPGVANQPADGIPAKAATPAQVLAA